MQEIFPGVAIDDPKIPRHVAADHLGTCEFCRADFRPTLLRGIFTLHADDWRCMGAICPACLAERWMRSHASMLDQGKASMSIEAEPIHECDACYHGETAAGTGSCKCLCHPKGDESC